jgi:hypothetical protein
MTASVARNAYALIATLIGASAATTASARNCEAWKGGSEVRCLSVNNGYSYPIWRTVTVQNRSSSTVTFNYQE